MSNHLLLTSRSSLRTPFKSSTPREGAGQGEVILLYITKQGFQEGGGTLGNLPVPPPLKSCQQYYTSVNVLLKEISKQIKCQYRY